MRALDAVVITGAGRGLGKAVAKRTAALGVPVLCMSRSGNAESTCLEIQQSGGQAESLVVDLADLAAAEDEVGRWISQKSYQRIGLVLCAAVTGDAGGIADGELENWLEVYRVNVLGNLAVLKALLPRMQEARFGRVVTFAGGGAAYAYPLFSGYALSKTAMVRATENLQDELKGLGDFLSVCVAPGAMETDMLAKVRAAGAEVRTTVSLEEPVEFVTAFLQAQECAFSGRFVHVRDAWREWMQTTPMPEEQWLLRRIAK